eukprot:scaffold45926_cov22-Prasinocladus_malaysianus.AAC.1
MRPLSNQLRQSANAAYVLAYNQPCMNKHRQCSLISRGKIAAKSMGRCCVGLDVVVIQSTQSASNCRLCVGLQSTGSTLYNNSITIIVCMYFDFYASLFPPAVCSLLAQCIILQLRCLNNLRIQRLEPC